MSHMATTLESDVGYLLRPGKLDFIWLEITQHCNLRCRHCYTNSSPARSHNGIDWDVIIRDAYDLGCRQIQLVGGEPLTHPDISKFIKTAEGLGYRFIEVYTNACLVDESSCSLLKSSGVNVATSFYSTDPEVHDKVTGERGSFGQTLRGIRSIIGGGIPLRVGLVLTDFDQEPAEDKICFLEALGVDRANIRIDHVRPVGRGAKLTAYESRSKTLCGACWDGMLTVSHDGNCYPCVFSRDHRVGNIKHQSLAEVLSSDELQSFRCDFYLEIQERKARQEITDCSPQCDPAGPCDPNCDPKCTPPCNPNPCGPMKPSCGPNNGDCLPLLCGPYNVCPPYKP